MLGSSARDIGQRANVPPPHHPAIVSFAPRLFSTQVETMSYIRHPNVVPFLGACLSGTDKLSLVTEYMTVRGGGEQGCEER